MKDYAPGVWKACSEPREKTSKQNLRVFSIIGVKNHITFTSLVPLICECGSVSVCVCVCVKDSTLALVKIMDDAGIIGTQGEARSGD